MPLASVVPACPISGLGELEGSSTRGVLAMLRYQISCQWLRSPGGPELTEGFGTEDFYRKGKKWEDGLQRKDHGPGLAGTKAAEGWAGM